jgi:hypothetical protein
VNALSKPQDFNGQKGAKFLDIRDWLQATEDYIATAHLAPSDASKIAFMQTYLKGEARRDWNVRKQAMAAACPATDPTATTAFPGCTFAAFKQALIDRWDPACTDVRARYSLDRLHKAPTKPMTQFVSAFDKLCSFVPTMQDEEKIHRSLTSLDDALAHELENDPSTKQRWTVYAELRRFALNSSASVFHAAKCNRPAADGMQQLLERGRNVRQRRLANRPPVPVQQQQFQPAMRPQGAATVTVTNADGVSVQREARIHNYCTNVQSGRNICAFCFTPGHHHSTCHARAGAQGYPAGFDPNLQRRPPAAGAAGAAGDRRPARHYTARGARRGG